MIGGKYTTYRKIAEESVSKIVKKPLINTEQNYVLYGSGTVKEDITDIANQYGLDPKTVEHVIDLYGARYRDVLDLTKENFIWKERLCECSPAIKAQVVYAIRVEMAQTLEDIYERRLSLSYRDCSIKKCRDIIQNML